LTCPGKSPAVCIDSGKSGKKLQISAGNIHLKWNINRWNIEARCPAKETNNEERDICWISLNSY
jgi:hypothetical protein